MVVSPDSTPVPSIITLLLMVDKGNENALFTRRLAAGHAVPAGFPYCTSQFIAALWLMNAPVQRHRTTRYCHFEQCGKGRSIQIFEMLAGDEITHKMNPV